MLVLETEHERRGIVNNVVFSCGAVVNENKIFLYCGAADKVIAVATLPIYEL
jgi:predicted GH43/DUF377 family glycosyl hydrolase